MNNGNETVNITPSPNKDAEFDIPDVQVSVSSSDGDYYTTDNEEMQP